MRIDERAPPDVHCGRRVTFETILTTGPSRCGAGFKAFLIIDEDECSPLDSVANRHEMIPLSSRPRATRSLASSCSMAAKATARMPPMGSSSADGARVAENFTKTFPRSIAQTLGKTISAPDRGHQSHEHEGQATVLNPARPLPRPATH